MTNHSTIAAGRAKTSARAVFETTASLQDWRRQVADLYAAVRAMPPQAGWQHWRGVRDRLFREHAQSPLAATRKAGFGGINYFSYDPTLRFEVGLKPATDRETISVEAGKDGAMVLRPYALTDGLQAPLGKELTLYWIEGYGGGTFLPFGDASNREETFPGGRYLLDTIKSADLGVTPAGRTILDFNFAYYPSCAYSEAWVCPLSPPENRLPGAIRGGERNPST
ncbi:DUF1684 domain-containing protein [Bosea caraganae]|uniref:DUF1684 domain-containing protein n=1 Tax=Bosea caraganae TaxID=2763117 RepID=A0A370L0D4_9HYPH|nr:DUF1684 domain-containing protein [Bosea caraganae]RDJ20703.1 DUF1684 domain-containing protein [Bosea caraganae]RDJ28980.1 DUF1684 domain-containing protein [Bosea caraganae]